VRFLKPSEHFFEQEDHSETNQPKPQVTFIHGTVEIGSYLGEHFELGARLLKVLSQQKTLRVIFAKPQLDEH